MYFFLSVQVRLSLCANACKLHEPYTLYLMCTVYVQLEKQSLENKSAKNAGNEVVVF